MISELKNLGLSDKEARVYAAMLELGPATMLEIATKAGINRPTAYVQIESLKKMGLASTQTKGSKHLFIAESPAQLAFILEREEKEIEQKKDILAKVLPELTTLFNLADEKPQVRFFEGKEGILAMLKEFLKTKDKIIYAISSTDAVLHTFPEHVTDYSSQRIAKKIHSKLIYTSTEGAFLKDSDKESLRESRFIAPERFSFASDITMYDNNIAITSFKGKPTGTIISNREIAQSFRGLFNFLWSLSSQ